MTDLHKPWEPDPRNLGNWTAMFEPKGGAAPATTPPAPLAEAGAEKAGGEHVGIDLSEYRPWKLQRGASRPAMMLALRQYDAKAGLWHSWGMPYPGLDAVEAIGGRVVSLDFGTRQFVIEGRGLEMLADHLQQGTVLAIVEYSGSIWAALPDGPLVHSIRHIENAR